MDRFTGTAGGVAAQHTLRNPIGCVGVGLHSGVEVEMRLCPAPAGHGVIFYRTDVGVAIPARHERVVTTCFATELAAADAPEIRVSTVEHVLAALAASGIDNARVELNGPEVPVLDGSAAPFVFLIDCAGVLAQEGARRELVITHAVRAGDGAGFAELSPPRDDRGLTMELSIAFPEPIIGQQRLALALSEESFRHDLAAARTFTTLEALGTLRAAGLARGGTLENAIVVDGGRVLNPSGLRRPDEFVRHKLLDAVGDLSLAGFRIRGHFHGHRSGHTLNHRLLERLFASPGAYRIVPACTALPLAEDDLALAAA